MKKAPVPAVTGNGGSSKMHNTNVYIRMGELQSILKVDPHDTPETDSSIEFSVPYENVYLFDAVTENVIE